MGVWLRRRKLRAQGQGQMGATPTSSHFSAGREPAPSPQGRQAGRQKQKPPDSEGGEAARPSAMSTEGKRALSIRKSPLLDSPLACISCAWPAPTQREATGLTSRAGDDGDEGSLEPLTSEGGPASGGTPGWVKRLVGCIHRREHLLQK